MREVLGNTEALGLEGQTYLIWNARKLTSPPSPTLGSALCLGTVDVDGESSAP